MRLNESPLSNFDYCLPQFFGLNSSDSIPFGCVFFKLRNFFPLGTFRSILLPHFFCSIYDMDKSVAPNCMLANELILHSTDRLEEEAKFVNVSSLYHLSQVSPSLDRG